MLEITEYPVIETKLEQNFWQGDAEKWSSHRVTPITRNNTQFNVLQFLQWRHLFIQQRPGLYSYNTATGTQSKKPRPSSSQQLTNYLPDVFSNWKIPVTSETSKAKGEVRMWQQVEDIVMNINWVPWVPSTESHHRELSNIHQSNTV